MTVEHIVSNLGAWSAAKEELAELEARLVEAWMLHNQGGGPEPTDLADEVALKRREVERLAQIAMDHTDQLG